MFKLGRYFSIASFVGIAVVVAALSLYYRHIATDYLIEHETRENVALAQALANAMWPKYASFVMNASNLPREQLAERQEVHQLRDDIFQQMKGLSVVKVKIYNLDGLTVFSTDPRQIGEEKQDNSGFARAREGQVASELAFRDEFYAFEQVISDRDLLSSYIPIRHKEEGTIEAVFELYADVTELRRELDQTQWMILGSILTAFSLLYLFLYLIVQRADRIIRTHNQQRQADEERIRFQAYHDALTGLPNRVSFMERVKDAIKRSRRLDMPFGVMFLDLDRFKLVNDSLGHDAGDQLLQVAAKRITSCVRETDMVFRMGGDEFTIVMENLDHAENTAIVARRIIDVMAEPIKVRDHEVIITTSIGISTFPKDDETAEKLVKNADAAMYRAKESGSNRYEFYTEDMNTTALQRLELETALQRALHNDEFILYYQPKVSSTTGAVVGMEALLRWQREEKGLVPPNEFIPFLEDTGLIIPVGEWVLRAACMQNIAWQKEGLPALRVSVNISTRQFRSESFVQSVRDILKQTGLKPEYLELELTENLLVDNAEAAIAIMEELKSIGVYLSIDDFGTGYSSLNYLKRFPVDYLKIDRSFIVDLTTSEKDAAITSAIAALAHNLNLGLVAEGVEENEQVAFLRTAGYQEMQGFLFSRPVPADELPALILAKNLPAKGRAVSS